MPTGRRKKTEVSSIPSKRSSFPVWLPLIVSFLYDYSVFYIGGIIGGFIFLAIMGYLFTKYSFILALFIIAFILLYILNKRFKDHW